MPYITREDGERFIIPSYRDVLSAKKPSLLRREILLLAGNYGEYITLQKKNASQYEIAFSPDSGALLGETVWHYFKRPRDLVYCEAISNTDAILVVVKSGSVYLDGSFPLDSIVEELVIFKTQQNNFDIYLYGDVPISQLPEDDKFSFDAASVKSFNILKKPVFPTLPTVKQFQLQLVNTVLKSQGIGVFPTKIIAMMVLLVALLWMGWDYISTHKKTISMPQTFIKVINPYELYISKLTSPNPAMLIHQLVNNTALFFTLPGWFVGAFVYDNNLGMDAIVKSRGARVDALYKWAEKNNVKVELTPDGFHLKLILTSMNRPEPNVIYRLDSVIANLIDRLSYIIPGNPLNVGEFVNNGTYKEAKLTIQFNAISPTLLNIIGQQLKMLPLILSKVNVVVTNGKLTGSIVLTALGN
ncbi:MAG: hypothetical protein K0R24_281 [Gammaproteobacteria bacterium]|jgi:hypothetical protein|nr:hypothetical protein [Gammaproteobacteria bacterium]